MTETPPRGSFDWLVGPVSHTVDVEIPKQQAGEHATLRVSIDARARVAPSRGWAVAIVVWGVMVLVLLATCHAGHARPAGASDGPWGQGAIGQQGWSTPFWGQQAIGQPWQDGRSASCRVSVYQGVRYVRCGPPR